jgi:hypothetical protein
MVDPGQVSLSLSAVSGFSFAGIYFPLRCYTVQRVHKNVDDGCHRDGQTFRGHIKAREHLPTRRKRCRDYVLEKIEWNQWFLIFYRIKKFLLKINFSVI